MHDRSPGPGFAPRVLALRQSAREADFLDYSGSRERAAQRRTCVCVCACACVQP